MLKQFACDSNTEGGSLKDQDVCDNKETILTLSSLQHKYLHLNQEFLTGL